MRGIAGRLTYANVVATLALVIAVAGGTAYAANTVFSEDTVNGEVKIADIGTNAVRSGKVLNENLTGADIAESGVDTCAVGVRRGQLCVRAENFNRRFIEAVEHCGNLSMRVPSLGEATELVRTHDIPNLDEFEFFWTDERFYDPDFDFQLVYKLSDSGTRTSSDLNQPEENSGETVCVTNPTN